MGPGKKRVGEGPVRNCLWESEPCRHKARASAKSETGLGAHRPVPGHAGRVIPKGGENAGLETGATRKLNQAIEVNRRQNSAVVHKIYPSGPMMGSD